jgi:hypothetical protein
VRDVSRSPAPPPSLASQTQYNGEDVRERLRVDFSDQCYLCEGYLERSWQVEHLRPRSAFPDREFDWTNLYPACAICNQRRLKWGRLGLFVDGLHKPWPVDGMLDPTGGDDIAGRLHQWIELGIGVEHTHVHFVARAPADKPASNTATELRHLHNGPREDAKLLREYIRGRLTQVLVRIGNLSGRSGDARTHILAEIRVMLAPTAPYASLLRECVRRVYEHDRRFLEELGL